LKVYADITTKGITVYSSGAGDSGMWETTFVPLPSGLFDANGRNEAPLNLPKFKAKSVVLVANTRKTIIRIADSPTGEQWELISKTFPIGSKMNETTHIFDGSKFVNDKGESRFFMAALPVETCNTIVKIGEALTGSIYNLELIDTVEHVLLRQYTSVISGGAVLILLPQDEGLRLLHIANGLPRSVGDISNNPQHREDEFSRYLQGIEKTALTKAVFLYREYEDISKWQWLHDHFVCFSGCEITFNMLQLQNKAS